MPRLPLAPLVALLAAFAAGCDSADSRLEPYTGVVEVALVSADGTRVLSLVAVDDTGCNHPLEVAVPVATPERLSVRVDGIRRPTGGTCRGIIPASARVPLPFTQQGTFPVFVEHAGSRDEYRWVSGVAGERLEAVRTATTRPG